MKTALFFSLCLAFLAVCLGGSFEVTGPVNAEPHQYTIDLPYVPDHSSMDIQPENITDYYVHIEYTATVLNPVGLLVQTVSDHPVITGIETGIPGEPYQTNDGNFSTNAIGEPTITPIEALPDLIVEISPAQNAVQGTQISLLLTIENVGTRRPVPPTVEFVLPGDYIDLIGASPNRPNITINITTIDGDYYFIVTWPGAAFDGAASDLDVTIDLFLHEDACEAFANDHPATRSLHETEQVQAQPALSERQQNNGTNSSSIQCPEPGYIDHGDYDPACRPDPECPDEFDLPTGACGAFCLQGVAFPDYSINIYGDRRRAVWRLGRNFVDKLTDDPTVNGTADPTVVYFFAILPDPSSSTILDDGGAGGGEDSSSENLVIILLPLFLGLLCLLCVAVLIATLLAALWWFLTGREKMRTRVQWIPGRNKGGDDDGL